jgi:uncharacterized membrane protein (DUF2068 family)
VRTWRPKGEGRCSAPSSRSPSTASRRILRLIAAFKFFKAGVLIAGGIGALRLLSPERVASVQGWLEGLVLERGHHVVAVAADRALALLHLAGRKEFSNLAIGAFFLAALYVVEGIGLALARRWAEYLTVAVTISFLPIEAVALWHRFTPMRAGTILVNLVVVAYLLGQLTAQRR